MNTEIKNKSGLRAYIFAGLGVGLLLFALYFNFSKPSFEMVDIYTDSTNNGKYVFLFVETKANSENDLMKWAYNIKNEGDLLDMPDKTKPSILTVYFYNPVDTVDLDVGIRMKLEERYADKPEFTHKINYSTKGWQYIGHKDPTIENIPRDTVYQTFVFVPKPGFKAYEIIKHLNE
jgi:hypothetical protein